MELNLIDKGKDSIDIEFDGVDESVIHMIITELNSDDKVKEASYTVGHPMIDKPRMHVVVVEGKPQTAVKKAIRQVGRQFKEARELFDKAAK